jgi:hypothetical protein
LVATPVRQLKATVMIAANHNSAEILGPINHPIGIRAVANDIAEIPDHVALWRGGKNRFESRKIGMDVGDNESAHFSLSVAALLCLNLSESLMISHS